MVVDSGRIQNHRPPHNNHSNNTLHTLVVEWSIFKTSRVRARERIQGIAPLFRATPLDTIPTTSRQFTNNITFTENTKKEIIHTKFRKHTDKFGYSPKN